MLHVSCCVIKSFLILCPTLLVQVVDQIPIISECESPDICSNSLAYRPEDGCVVVCEKRFPLPPPNKLVDPLPNPDVVLLPKLGVPKADAWVLAPNKSKKKIR